MYDDFNNEDLERNENKQKPKHTGLAVFGIVLFVIGICLFISNFFILPTMGNEGFISIYSPVSAFSGMALMVVGSILARPILTKYSAKYEKHVINYAKDDLKELGKTSAEVASPAVKIIAQSAKEGFNDADGQSNTNTTYEELANDENADDNNSYDELFCSNCGKKIKANSKFCRYCGYKQ